VTHFSHHLSTTPRQRERDATAEHLIARENAAIGEWWAVKVEVFALAAGGGAAIEDRATAIMVLRCVGGRWMEGGCGRCFGGGWKVDEGGGRWLGKVVGRWMKVV
jgi:hypothetical protein